MSKAKKSETVSRKAPPKMDGTKYATPSRESESPILPTVSAESSLVRIAARFPLPWSAYVRLLAVKSEHARRFYEAEALRGGWQVTAIFGQQAAAQLPFEITICDFKTGRPQACRPLGNV